MNTAIAPVVGHVDIKIVSLNVLAPCYNNVKIDGVLICESEREDLYLSRHENICKHLQQTQADVICIQEFWLSSEKIKKLYIHMLCETYGYIKKSLRRTSHWRTRDDGLAVFVKNDTIEIQDCQNILFHDCGDRVAMLLLLAIRPSSILHHHVLSHSTNIEPLKPQQFIVINTHLLFPHNTYSTNIRLREATKILGFAELYRQRELCTTICNRADIRLPVIVTGDFNGMTYLYTVNVLYFYLYTTYCIYTRYMYSI
jgi:exonuclease III